MFTKMRVKKLTEKLSDSDYTVRVKAIKKLIRINDKSLFNTLCQIISDKLGTPIIDWRLMHEELIWKVTDFLIDNRDEEVTESLLKVLMSKDDNRIELYENICYAFEKNRDVKVIDSIIQLTAHENSRIRKAAISCLIAYEDKKIIDVLTYLLNNPEDEIKKTASLGLCKIIEKDMHSRLLKSFSFPFIGKYKNPYALAVLDKALEHKNQYVLMNIVKGYKELDDKGAIPGLIKALGICSHDERRLIADVLKYYGDESWASVVKGDRHDFEKMYQLNGERIIDMLILMLNHPNDSIRAGSGQINYTNYTEALKIIAQIAHPCFYEPLVRAFHRGYYNANGVFFDAFIAVDNRNVIDVMFNELKPHNDSKLGVAVSILKHYNDPRLKSYLKQIEPNFTVWYEKEFIRDTINELN